MLKEVTGGLKVNGVVGGIEEGGVVVEGADAGGEEEEDDEDWRFRWLIIICILSLSTFKHIISFCGSCLFHQFMWF